MVYLYPAAPTSARSGPTAADATGRRGRPRANALPHSPYSHQRTPRDENANSKRKQLKTPRTPASPPVPAAAAATRTAAVPLFQSLAEALQRNSIRQAAVGDTGAAVIYTADAAAQLAPFFERCRSLETLTIHMGRTAPPVARALLASAARSRSLTTVRIVGGVGVLEAKALVEGLAHFRRRKAAGDPQPSHAEEEEGECDCGRKSPQIHYYYQHTQTRDRQQQQQQPRAHTARAPHKLLSPFAQAAGRADMRVHSGGVVWQRSPPGKSGGARPSSAVPYRRGENDASVGRNNPPDDERTENDRRRHRHSRPVSPSHYGHYHCEAQQQREQPAVAMVSPRYSQQAAQRQADAREAGRSARDAHGAQTPVSTPPTSARCAQPLRLELCLETLDHTLASLLAEGLRRCTRLAYARVVALNHTTASADSVDALARKLRRLCDQGGSSLPATPPTSGRDKQKRERLPGDGQSQQQRRQEHRALAHPHTPRQEDVSYARMLTEQRQQQRQQQLRTPTTGVRTRCHVRKPQTPKPPAASAAASQHADKRSHGVSRQDQKKQQRQRQHRDDDASRGFSYSPRESSAELTPPTGGYPPARLAAAIDRRQQPRRYVPETTASSESTEGEFDDDVEATDEECPSWQLPSQIAASSMTSPSSSPFYRPFGSPSPPPRPPAGAVRRPCTPSVSDANAAAAVSSAAQVRQMFQRVLDSPRPATPQADDRRQLPHKEGRNTQAVKRRCSSSPPAAAAAAAATEDLPARRWSPLRMVGSRGGPGGSDFFLPARASYTLSPSESKSHSGGSGNARSASTPRGNGGSGGGSGGAAVHAARAAGEVHNREGADTSVDATTKATTSEIPQPPPPPSSAQSSAHSRQRCRRSDHQFRSVMVDCSSSGKSTEKSVDNRNTEHSATGNRSCGNNTHHEQTGDFKVPTAPSRVRVLRAQKGENDVKEASAQASCVRKLRDAIAATPVSHKYNIVDNVSARKNPPATPHNSRDCHPSKCTACTGVKPIQSPRRSPSPTHPPEAPGESSRDSRHGPARCRRVPLISPALSSPPLSPHSPSPRSCATPRTFSRVPSAHGRHSPAPLSPTAAAAAAAACASAPGISPSPAGTRGGHRERRDADGNATADDNSSESGRLSARRYYASDIFAMPAPTLSSALRRLRDSPAVTLIPDEDDVVFESGEHDNSTDTDGVETDEAGATTDAAKRSAAGSYEGRCDPIRATATYYRSIRSRGGALDETQVPRPPSGAASGPRAADSEPSHSSSPPRAKQPSAEPSPSPAPVAVGASTHEREGRRGAGGGGGGGGVVLTGPAKEARDILQRLGRRENPLVSPRRPQSARTCRDAPRSVPGANSSSPSKAPSSARTPTSAAPPAAGASPSSFVAQSPRREQQQQQQRNTHADPHRSLPEGLLLPSLPVSASEQAFRRMIDHKYHEYDSQTCTKGEAAATAPERLARLPPLELCGAARRCLGETREAVLWHCAATSALADTFARRVGAMSELLTDRVAQRVESVSARLEAVEAQLAAGGHRHP